MSKFNIGDTVVVTEEIRKPQHRDFANPDMFCYIGKKTKVCDTCYHPKYDTVYVLECSGRFVWQSCHIKYCDEIESLLGGLI